MMQMDIKNRVLFWLLLFLIILNLGAFITWFVVSKQKPTTTTCVMPESGGCMILSQELNLTPSQSKQADTILCCFQAESRSLADAIRERRISIMEILSGSDPDTNKLKQLTQELAGLQVDLQKVNIRQFIALKEICTPEQLECLSNLFLEMYGCPMKEKGKQNRYRHGWECESEDSQ